MAQPAVAPSDDAGTGNSSGNGCWRGHRIGTRDGLVIHARDYGQHGTPAFPVVCLPGLTRSSRDFHALAGALASHSRRPRRVLAIDARGRGLSQRDRNWRNYTPLTEALDVLDVMAATGIERACLIGTSRGGLLAMTIAALRPTAIAACVLNDIGPEMDARGLIRLKRTLSGMRPPENWSHAAALMRSAYEGQFPGLDDADWRAFARRTYADRDGMPVPDFDRAIIRTLTRMDFDRPLPTLWPQFDALCTRPVLAIRGARSDVLSAETWAAMRARQPDIETLEVAGAGHAPFLDSAAEIERIAAFLTRVEGRRSA